MIRLMIHDLPTEMQMKFNCAPAYPKKVLRKPASEKWREFTGDSEQRAIILRNPHGLHDWTGPWTTLETWRKNHTVETGYGIPMSNGEFFMEYTQFLKVDVLFAKINLWSLITAQANFWVEILFQTFENGMLDMCHLSPEIEPKGRCVWTHKSESTGSNNKVIGITFAFVVGAVQALIYYARKRKCTK